MKKSFTPECKELSHRNEKPFQSEWKNSFSQECKKLSPNDTDINNTEINHTDIQSINHDPKQISDTEKDNNICLSNLDEKSESNSVHETYSIEYLREQFETAILEQNNGIYKELTELIYDVALCKLNTTRYIRKSALENYLVFYDLKEISKLVGEVNKVGQNDRPD
jgi:hypothetical protein